MAYLGRRQPFRPHLSKVLPGQTLSLSITESLTLSDSISNSTTKILSESLSISDNRVMAIGKILSESLSLSDTLSFSVLKALLESLTLVDTMTEITHTPLKRVSESTSGDGIALSTGRGNIKLSSGLDAISKRVGKA